MKNLFNWIKNFILELKHNLKLLYIINIISIILATLPFLNLLTKYHSLRGIVFYIPVIFIIFMSLIAVKTYKKFPKTTKWITAILGFLIIIFVQIYINGFFWVIFYCLEMDLQAENLSL